ncbi:MAG TPA: hypothetical protein VEO53_15260 [Candidatus Binatia bacterium]|nr:hypothetical protein [Candidatus Binatia bacterium]
MHAQKRIEALHKPQIAAGKMSAAPIGTMQLQMGSAVVSTAAVGVPPTRWHIGEWDPLPHLFGETPNRATGTVTLPFSDRYGSSESKSMIKIKITRTMTSTIIS